MGDAREEEYPHWCCSTGAAVDCCNRRLLSTTSDERNRKQIGDGTRNDVDFLSPRPTGEAQAGREDKSFQFSSRDDIYVTALLPPHQNCITTQTEPIRCRLAVFQGYNRKYVVVDALS